jgi:hypothetical protein
MLMLRTASATSRRMPICDRAPRSASAFQRDTAPDMIGHQIEWNAAQAQWFCIKCLIASDHVNKQDAQIELDRFECVLPKPSPKL